VNSIGSVWRNWDLHLHTPASFHWPDKRLQEQTDAEREPTCKAIVEKMNSFDLDLDLDVDASCILDYWLTDGYLAVRDYPHCNPCELKKRLIPGIELRLEASTDFRLNTNVRFDDEVLLSDWRTFWQISTAVDHRQSRCRGKISLISPEPIRLSAVYRSGTQSEGILAPHLLAAWGFSACLFEPDKRK
jgi:hypothetical protein